MFVKSVVKNIMLVFAVMIYVLLWIVNKLAKTIQHWTIFPLVKITLCFKTICQSFRFRNDNVAPLKIISDQKIVMIETTCMPVICADLLNQNIQHVSTRYTHLTGLKLAGTSKNLNKRIEIWLGLIIIIIVSFLGKFQRVKSTNQLLSIPCLVWFYPDVLTIPLPST